MPIAASSPTLRVVATSVVLAALAGCKCPPKVADDSIDLVTAMKQVGEGIKELRRTTAGTPTGLLIDEVTVEFEVGVSRKDDVGGGISLTVPNVPVGFNANASRSDSSNRGNTITIKLKNLLSQHVARPPQELEQIFALARKNDLLIGAAEAIAESLAMGRLAARDVPDLSAKSEAELLAIIATPPAQMATALGVQPPQ